MSKDANATDGTEQCPNCNRVVNELVEVGDWTDHNEVCGYCIRDYSKRYTREGERGQGQRPIGEQHAIERSLHTDTEHSEDSP